MGFALPFLLAACAQDPLAGQLPKQDLGVEAFLAEHPEFDGRGIRVAILDTGVDPGHPFLQRTPDGRRKIVDWYDATTDGRVDTTLRAQATDGTLTGLSGRRLTLGAHAAGGREYRLGRIGAEFLPADLRARIGEGRREKWQEGRRQWQEALARDAARGGTLDEDDARQTELRRNWEEYRDPGPCWDLVAWREADGAWRIVTDADEDGDLGEEPALRTFRASGDWHVLGAEALLHYAVEVEQGGDQVVLFFDSNGHGTHVAGIVGGWDGPHSRLNGLAPGVEFVAIKIGDGKYGGSTSGFAIAKALDFAVAAGCQVANMSFGGPSFFADGREPEARAVAEAAQRGLFLVCSAGNEGPTLSTVGSPATVPYALAIAAAIWPDTQRANYASIAPAGTVLFDFSSRGPLPSGSLGVDFVAPGAALSPLPAWTLTMGENFNGTSMAAPQMAGCVALLRCAARAEGLRDDWQRIYRALRLSARPLDGFTWTDFGHGAIRMDRALEALRTLSGMDGVEREYVVEVANPFGVGAGIYERRVAGGAPFDRAVRIAPRFDDESSNAERAAALRTLRARAEADWVQVPEALPLNSAGRSITVRVDPSGLAPGLHVTRIVLHDADLPEAAGPELVIPVTYVAAERADAEGRYARDFRLAPGGLERVFVEVPYGARSAHVELRQRGGPRNEVRTGAGSVSGFSYAGDRQMNRRWFLADGDLVAFDAPAEAGTVWELAIAARWSSNGAADYELRVRFDGLAPSAEELRVPPGQEVGYLAVRSLLRDAAVEVSATVAGVAVPLTAPLTIQPDPIRPVIFGDLGMFLGVIEQEFEVAKDDTAAALVIAHAIQTTEWREDLMIEIFDAAGAVVNRAIAYEIETDLGALAAGRYTLRLSFPALGRAPLETAFAGAELRLAGGGGGATLYASLDDALTGAHATARQSVPARGARTFFVRLPELEALPPGSEYYGRLTARSGGATLLAVPLRVQRPGAASPDAPPADAAATPSAAEAAWTKAQADAAASGAQRIAAARAWQEAEPQQPRATLAVMDALHAAGLTASARAEARDFLRRFPRERDALLAAASRWP
jgi:tripeptidyl-peptidase-2